MRVYGALSPIDGIPLPPDSVQTLFMTGGSSAQAMDWPGAPANAAAGAAHLVRFSGMTTGSALYNFMVNLVSTHAAIPTSGSSVTTGTTAGSTGNNIPVIGDGRIFQIPPWSTGWSAAGLSSGYVIAEVWRK
jgi:hypothetical protein